MKYKIGAAYSKEWRSILRLNNEDGSPTEKSIAVVYEGENLAERLCDFLNGEEQTVEELKARLDFKASELYLRNTTLTLLQRDVETARLNASHWKDLADNMRAANAALVENEAQLQKKVDEFSKKAALYSLLENYYNCPGQVGNFINKLRAEIVEQNVELSRLRPPEAKFRVGQVVLCTNPGTSNQFPVKIAKALFYRQANKWSYTDSCNRAWFEEYLRALTDEEK